MKKSLYDNQALDWYFAELASGRSNQAQADALLHLIVGNKSPKASKMLFNRATKSFNSNKPLSKLIARAKYYAAKHGFVEALERN